ncbi:tryptophan synthase subunit alpha [Clostridium algidicarnis]|uniref:tryptophan synthase subunit alpha n=1 Tax=Clostridium algidicarnis TaxID=37659 RepID=UPI001C0D2EBB|nr:tryptophan synthase subunit alpha [Clostridium algidicarnis]MBU3202805.1 tryptophan synthase subunit alpha [Clostridium algidicarnis]MBU3210959.1 tryptophan synthase subunit alpha [Clostridium algidicarnis]MBU3222533.1 tryptophan synthase subunit alpha [Clostridium algidicarnis]
MDSRISRKLNKLKEEKRKALITYIAAGDPSLDKTMELVLTMEKAGADIMELGIPYSDPLADGPVIQRASIRALSKGINIDYIFSMVLNLRCKTEIPLVFLIYYNTIFSYGIEEFLNRCKECGIDGLIIPDLPLEERKILNEMMKDYPIDLIALVAPTSNNRIKEIVEGSSGFIYCISSKGVTGTRETFDEELKAFMEDVRRYSKIPLAIGFGISDAKSVRNLKDLADGLIVGSAIIKQIEKGIELGNIEGRVFEFVKSLREAIDE